MLINENIFMPDDLSEEVRSMVEDQWISDETAIVSDLIGQVTELQGKQTLAVLNQHEAKFKQDVMRIYQTQGRHAGAKEANNLRLKMLKEIEEFWIKNSFKISDQELKKIVNN